MWTREIHARILFIFSQLNAIQILLGLQCSRRLKGLVCSEIPSDSSIIDIHWYHDLRGDLRYPQIVQIVFRSFQDISQLMSLIINAFYTNKEIFLRELLLGSKRLTENGSRHPWGPEVPDCNPDYNVEVQPCWFLRSASAGFRMHQMRWTRFSFRPKRWSSEASRRIQKRIRTFIAEAFIIF